MLEKSEGTVTNGQSRDTGIRQKLRKTTQKTKKTRITPTKTGMNPDTREG